MSIAALRDEMNNRKRFWRKRRLALSQHQGALAASKEARRRRSAAREARREVREAAAGSVSLTVGRRGVRARHPGRGAGESRGCDHGSIAERAGSSFKRLDVIPAQWRVLVTRRPNTSVAAVRGLLCRRTHRITSCPAAANRSGHRARDRLQVWRPYAIFSSGRDLRAPGDPA